MAVRASDVTLRRCVAPEDFETRTLMSVPARNALGTLALGTGRHDVREVKARSTPSYLAAILFGRSLAGGRLRAPV